ncbi:MAG: hypothetical protein GDA51_06245 [Ekhidna sp.]|nr:hypothetical protein [Ekhidna sp.]
MLCQSRDGFYDAIVVILNLEGFSNIIHPQWLPFSSKHVCVQSAKAAGEWRSCRKVFRPQKTKVSASPK